MVALGALLYAVLFIAIVEGAGRTTREVWYFTLMLGGAATVPVLVALYHRLRLADPGLALTAFVLGLGGAFGGILHGAYSLASSVTPPKPYAPGPEEVSRGVLRYAVAGVAFLLVAWLIHRSGLLPVGLGYLGYLGGAVLIFIYIGRLFDFIKPSDYLSIVPPIVYGFVIHPLFYAWLGLIFLRAGPALRRPVS